MKTSENILSSQETVTQKLQQVLEMTKRGGATDAEVEFHNEIGYSATARMGEVETLEYNNDNNLTIIVYQGKKSSSVTTSDLRQDSLQAAVDSALRIAHYAEEDPFVGIAESKYLRFAIPELELTFPWELTPQAALAMAVEGDKFGLAFAKQIHNSDGTSVSNHNIIKGYANSNDFNGIYTSTQHNLTSVLVAEQNGKMQRDYYYYTACDAKDLPSIESIAKIAAQRTVDRLNVKPIKTQRTKVLFTAESARSLLKHFVNAISGSALYKKSSFLLDQLGETIFPEWFNLYEQPHLPKALGSTPFDNHGLITYAKPFVEQGRLKNYALGVYAARKLNMQPTANAGGIHNLVVTPGRDDFTQMLAQLGTGLLVTEVMGPGVNIVTGDYSRGIAGYWVEQGEIIHAVDEATIAGNLQSIFKDIIAVGNDVDTRTKFHTPSILVADMMVAGAD